jgi:hypothetical protein
VGDIVNLRKARKDRARAAKADKAAENRVRFGRTRAEKAGDTAEATRVTRTLDGAKRTPQDDTPDRTSKKP